jgi:hypothetical protein
MLKIVNRLPKCTHLFQDAVSFHFTFSKMGNDTLVEAKRKMPMVFATGILFFV